MPKRPITPEDLLKMQFVGDPQISPDGTRILFTRKHISDKNKYVGNLWTVDLDGVVRQWTQGEEGVGCGRWSADGTRIAFVSGRDKPASQIFVLPADGGEAAKLTSLEEGSISEIRWSPDGAWIAFGFRPQHPDWTEKAKKEREEKGLSTPARELDDLKYRLDGDGYFLGQRYAIYLVDTQTGKHRKLYESHDDDFSFDWSPSSKELAVVRSVAKRPLFDPANDQIFRVDLEGQAWMLEGLPMGPKSAVRWSPDGKSIAYAGHIYPNERWGSRNVRAWVVPAQGGEPRCLTCEQDFCLDAPTLGDSKEASFGANIVWAADSSGLYAQIGWRGGTQVGWIDAKAGGLTLLTDGPHTINFGNVSEDGAKLACVFSDFERLSEVAVYDLKTKGPTPRVLTKMNRDFHAEIECSEPIEFVTGADDGYLVHGWYMLPLNYTEPKRYPAILQIHGGPSTQYGCTYFHEMQVLAAQGYVVVFTNPRGSKGYGEEHTSAIRGCWGDKDWMDIQAATRWMQHQPFIHPGSIGIMGGSYGGYMTNWAVGHSKDYKAAITDRCVSNLVSMAGSSDFPNIPDNYWPGCAFGSLDRISELWKQSPLAYFEDVDTPMLIIHSEGDLRCNVEQAEQVFTALQTRGIESRFVRYPPSTFHGLSRNGPPDLRLHRLHEILKWWRRHLA